MNAQAPSPRQNMGARFGRGRHGFHGPAEKPKDVKATLLRIWGLLEQHKPALVRIFALSVLVSVLSVLPPVIIGQIIDRFINRFVGGKLAVNFLGAFQSLLLLACVYLANSTASWGENRLMISLTQKVIRSLREALFEKLQRLSLRYHDAHPKGDLMSRFTNDIDTLNTCLSHTVIQFFSSILSLSGSLCMMLWLNSTLALSLMTVVPLSFVAGAYVARLSRQHFADQQNKLGALNTSIEESISGMRAVKVFRKEEAMSRRFLEGNRALRTAGTKAQMRSGILIPILIFCGNLGYIVVVLVGGWLALKGRTSVGVLQAFLLYSRAFTRPLNELANQLNAIQSAVAGGERIFETLDEVPEITERPSALSLQNVKGTIEFRDVTFGYDTNQAVLKNVSFRAEAGCSLAIVGHTGAGKTTIVNLLNRFYDVWSGSVELDGRDIRTLTLESLHRSLGTVLQDSVLFSESVKENVAYGRPEATEAEIVRAAKAAGAHEFICALPEGYDTNLSQASLSRGQRQLLAIAQVLLLDPPLLLLDEATSNIDTLTEIQLQKSILKLMKGRTSIVIAHRLSTIQNADLILVMKGGEIVERGSHPELLARRGEYRAIYEANLSESG